MRKFFILSFGFHLALFTPFFVRINFVQHNVGAHEKIIAYLYQQQLLMQHQEKLFQLPINKQAKKNSAERSKAASSHANQQVQQTLGEPDELLTLLHNMIEVQINHADFFNQEQKIYVTFTLFPDGHIENIRLLECSASANLNLAVIKAVNAIQPVTSARNFLSVPHEFKIRIIQLTAQNAGV